MSAYGNHSFTLLDLYRASNINPYDPVVGLIEEDVALTPEMQIFPHRTKSGTSYKVRVRTNYPDAQFRNINEGVCPDKSKYEERQVNMFFIDFPIDVDEALPLAELEAVETLKADEAQAAIVAIGRAIGRQVWYGNHPTLGHPKGFPGFTQLYDAGEMTVDAGGGTAGAHSSVWAVRFGLKDVHLVWHDTLMRLTEWTRQQMAETNVDTGECIRRYFAEVANMRGWVGLQCVNNKSVGRIANIAESGANVFVEDMAFDLLEKFPAGYRPDAFFMTRRTRRQLRQDRKTNNSTNRTIDAVPNSQPTDIDGIPIYVTDSLSNTEA